jgi:N-acetylmuramoyl-L-alanine amidase
MAHSAYMKYSEKFSEYLDKHFTSGFGLPNRGVKQAGFYVLVGASMPGVLIESGFLSNHTDAQYLNSKKGQQKPQNLYSKVLKVLKPTMTHSLAQIRLKLPAELIFFAKYEFLLI